MANKILSRVTSCGACPNYVYYSGGVYNCRLVDEAVRDKEQVAPFCPLPDYPSRVIADMETTITMLRKPMTYGFDLALLSFLAAKLKVNVHSRGSSITIPLIDDGKVVLSLDYISRVELRPFRIYFSYDGRSYKIYADSGYLHEKVSPPKGVEEPEGGLWRPLTLAK